MKKTNLILLSLFIVFCLCSCNLNDILSFDFNELFSSNNKDITIKQYGNEVSEEEFMILFDDAIKNSILQNVEERDLYYQTKQVNEEQKIFSGELVNSYLEENRTIEYDYDNTIIKDCTSKVRRTAEINSEKEDKTLIYKKDGQFYSRNELVEVNVPQSHYDQYLNEFLNTGVVKTNILNDIEEIKYTGYQYYVDDNVFTLVVYTNKTHTFYDTCKQILQYTFNDNSVTEINSLKYKSQNNVYLYSTTTKEATLKDVTLKTTF